MVLFPEEVDVYLQPHIRMKTLVDEYLIRLTTTDFKDASAVRSLLTYLQRTFSEFKWHENIESYYIMDKLQARLKELSISNCEFCNQHPDNQLSEILSLMKEGYRSCLEPSQCFNFANHLRRILSEFTEAFLPHMREEEEVVQPLLIKYFDYEELKSLKITVLQKHSQWEENQFDCFEIDSFCLEKDDNPDERNPFSLLPMEMSLNIFSYLSQIELLKFRRVCHQWMDYLIQPCFWNNLNVPGLLTEFFKENKSTIDRPADKIASCLCLSSVDLDADFHQKQNDFLMGMTDYLLPMIGLHVQKLVISWVECLTALQLREIIIQCPNVHYLDVSGTNITEATFEMTAKQTFCKLTYLDMSGCCNITDEALVRFATAWQIGRKSLRTENDELRSGLSFLSLSGCHRVTDYGISALSICGLLNPLMHMDLSGCYLITGDLLQQLVTNCTSLQAESISYCNNVDGGPCEANGCNNLDSRLRFCCSVKQF